MVDIHATVREVMGIDASWSIHGRSLIPLLSGESAQVREGVLFGTYGVGAGWVDDAHVFFTGYDNEVESPHWYSTMPACSGHEPNATSGFFLPDVDVPVWRYPHLLRWTHKTKMEPAIYAKKDEEQRTDLSTDPKLLSEKRSRLSGVLEQLCCPTEQFSRLRLGK